MIWLNGDELDVQNLFANVSATRLKYIFGNKKYIVIDEAQRIKDIGLKLKLITDEMPEVQLIAIGSSSFDLANEVNEPLTGRRKKSTISKKETNKNYLRKIMLPTGNST